MSILIFFSVVLLFSLALNIVDKVRSYNKRHDCSIWQDGDSVVVKPKDTPGIMGGFGIRLDETPEKSDNNKLS